MQSLRWAGGGAVAALVTVAAVALSSGACGGNAFSAGPGDAAVDGALLDTAMGGGDGAYDAGDGASSGKIVYVSDTTGSDTNSGTDSKKPKKTIASALAAAATIGAGTEVHVCAGNYAESSLVVNQDVKLAGSFDCVLWARTASYGWPTFDMKNQSVITNAAPTAQAATLVVQGASVTSATVIDGFAIAGASGTSGPSIGVDVQGQASPVISNDVVSGATENTAPAGPYGTVGIRVGGSSTAEVTLNEVGGGGGTGAIGSVGIVVISTGAAAVHDDLVSGGTGTSNNPAPGFGAVGVALLGATSMPAPLTGLLVSGSDTAGLPGKSVGIYVAGAGVGATIGGCEIQGGTGTGSGTSSAGIDLETTGNVALLANRIFGGTRKGGTSQTFGVHVGGVGTLSIFDSEIHAGEIASNSNSSAMGVFVQAASAPALVDDTIYTGAAGNSPAIDLGSGVTNAVVSGDILLGGGGSSSDVAMLVDKCSGTFASIDHSAAVNFPVLYECMQPASGIATDPGALATELGSSVVSPTNVEIESVCAGSMGWCIADSACPSTPPTACAQSIFGATFTSADDGVSGLFDGPPAADGGTTPGAWTLAPGVSCALAHNGVVNSNIPTDIFGTTRGSMPSMGAVQYTQNAPCAAQ